MEFSRRRTLRLVGASLSSAAVAGCLSAAGPGAGDDEDPSGDDDGDGSDPTGTPGDGEFPREDEPPYEITEPACGDDQERDPLWLCENMPAEPSLAFDQVATTGRLFADEGLRQVDGAGDDQYYATFLADAGAVDRLHDEASGEVLELIEGTDFDTHAVLVAQHGWGSGSKTPHLERIEDASEGLHAHGCIRQPCIWTDDVTVRSVVARVERPASLDGSRVSLTVDAETRVTFGVEDW